MGCRVLAGLVSVSLFGVVACGDDGGATSQSADGSTGTGAVTTDGTDPAESDATTSTSADTSGPEPSTTSAGSEASTSSTDDGDTNGATMPVSIAFAAVVGAEPFACGQTYESVGTPPTSIEPRDLRFFVQDVELVRASDDEAVPVVLDVAPPWQAETVALVDFEDATGACADGGGDPEINAVVTGTVPLDDYVGVRFSIGVPADLNHQDPLELPDPLQASSMTWGWLYGFKFVKAEVQEVVPDGPEGSGQFHLGSNGCTGMPAVEEVQCALPNRPHIELAPFDAAVDTVVVDVAAMFAGTDLTVDTQCHSFQAECEPMFEQLGLDLASGRPTTAQVVFDVQ
jgi:uncharacterized repeat protein (TIGR04052 family)